MRARQSVALGTWVMSSDMHMYLYLHFGAQDVGDFVSRILGMAPQTPKGCSCLGLQMYGAVFEPLI